ncbi:Chaperone protein DnaJ [Psilocybe cubensis]|uniref:Chaperone protein DnaJ n=2 Tax=Psilocybe cubensis TaxID=181762 RepID=A0ACB8GUU6_PSICU|nr:Chaperone protein DnaJ [Psilocybe cubensis]KAH9479515.1 Chaperone protein DnaJ [Psilocybe cubensis]
MPFFKDHYEVLGIESDASNDEIRKAYHKRALQTHPDKLDPNASESDKQHAEEEFRKVYEAFEVLGDAIKRKAYDIRMKARANPTRISEEAARRVKERKEWALRQHQEKLNRAAQLEREKREKQEALVNMKMKKEAAMVSELLKAMYQSNPEFAKRREAALQRKAERERAEMFKHSQHSIHS